MCGSEKYFIATKADSSGSCLFFPTKINLILLSSSISENRAGQSYSHILSRKKCSDTVGKKRMFQKVTARELVHVIAEVAMFP